MPHKAETHPEHQHPGQEPVDEREQGAGQGESPETGEQRGEEHAGGQGESAQTPSADELQTRLDQALARAEENWELAVRTQAEMENLRKRTQRDVDSAHKYALEKIAGELLGVRDSMELGLSAAQENADVEKLLEGAELTLKMLSQVMEKFGIREVNPVNERFNPDLHQAMATQESEKLEPNTVVSVMQKGYTLNDRLLRPALVTVARAPRESGEGGGE